MPNFPALTPATKEANELVRKSRTGPFGFLESRTGTRPRGVMRLVATSMH